MNVFKRKEWYAIEGMPFKRYRNILTYQDEEVSIDTELADSILLTDGKLIKCVKNYYNNSKKEPLKKKCSCPAVQRFLVGEIVATPFDCTACHLRMMNKRRSGEIYLK